MDEQDPQGGKLGRQWWRKPAAKTPDPHFLPQRPPQYLHVLHALRRLFQAVPANEVVVNLSVFDSSIRRLPTSHDLPHGDPKGPLGQNGGWEQSVTRLPEPGLRVGIS